MNLKNSTQRVSTVNWKSLGASAKKNGCAVEARTKKTVLDGRLFFVYKKNRGRQIVALSNVFYLCAQTPRVISLVNKALRVAFCCNNFTAYHARSACRLAFGGNYCKVAQAARTLFLFVASGAFFAKIKQLFAKILVFIRRNLPKGGVFCAF